MASRRRTCAGRSSTSSNGGVLNESIALDANDLLAMLAGEESEEESLDEEDEGRDIVTDLDGQFAGSTNPSERAELTFELKRKRESEEGACLWCVCVSTHVIVGYFFSAYAYRMHTGMLASATSTQQRYI